MADVTLAASGIEDAPFDYPVPGAAELLIKFLAASYDGSGAGGSFVPAVQLVIGGSVVVATFPLGSSIAAGASADVAWFPRGGVSQGGGGSGIQFDTFPQSGDWLFTETTNAAGSPDGYGTELIDTSGAGINVATADSQVTIGNVGITGVQGVYIASSDGTTGPSQPAVAIESTNFPTSGSISIGNLFNNQGLISIGNPAAGGTRLIEIQGDNTAGKSTVLVIGSLTAQLEVAGSDAYVKCFDTEHVLIGGGAMQIAFFGGAPVGQQVSGGTLAGVIAGLVALGLFSS